MILRILGILAEKVSRTSFTSLIVIKLCLLLLLSGCNNPFMPDYWEYNIPETSGTEVFGGDPEPVRPPWWDGQKGFLGIDSDNDGVRDDVEIFLNRNQKDPVLRILYKHYYKAYTKAVKGLDDDKKFFALKMSYQNLMSCISAYEVLFKTTRELIKGNKFINSYLGIVKNTEERMGLYRMFYLKEPYNYTKSPQGEAEIEFLNKFCPYPEDTKKRLINKLKRNLE